MQILIVIGAVLLILSTLLQWSLLLQHDRDILSIKRGWQTVHVVAHRPHEIGEVHPFAPDAVVTARDDLLNGGPYRGFDPVTAREVREGSP